MVLVPANMSRLSFGPYKKKIVFGPYKFFCFRDNFKKQKIL